MKKSVARCILLSMLFLSSQSFAGTIPEHCHKSIFKGYGTAHNTKWAKKAARATWRANILRESGMFQGLDDILWRSAIDKSYSCGRKWGVRYCTVKARPCSALQE